MKLLESTSICFIVVANNGTKLVTVEGTYDTSNVLTTIAVVGDYNITTLHATAVTVIVIIPVSIIAIIIIAKRAKKGPFKLEISNTVLDIERDEQFTDQNQQWQTIDETTTYYRVHQVEVKCSMCEFARKHYQNYQPEDGFGYFKKPETKLELIAPHKKIILMDQVSWVLINIGMARI